MFGKSLYILDILYVVIAITSLIANKNVSSNYIGLHENMFSIDPRAILYYQQMKAQQPHLLRSMFWYKARAPKYVGGLRRKPSMGNSHIPQRYKRMPYENFIIFGATPRPYFRNMNDVPTVSAAGFKYKLPSKLPVASSTQSALPNNAYPQNARDSQVNLQNNRAAPVNLQNIIDTQVNLPKRDAKENLQYTERDNQLDLLNSRETKVNYKNDLIDNSTLCKNQLVGKIACAEPAFLKFPFSYNDHIPVPIPRFSNIRIKPPTTTSVPYAQYTSHTYFTLEDAIMPYSYSSKNVYDNTTTKDYNDALIYAHKIFTTTKEPFTISDNFVESNKISKIFETTLSTSTLPPATHKSTHVETTTPLPILYPYNIITTTAAAVKETTILTTLLSHLPTLATTLGTFQSFFNTPTTSNVYAQEKLDLQKLFNKTCRYCMASKINTTLSSISEDANTIVPTKLQIKKPLRIKPMEKYKRKLFRGIQTKKHFANFYENDTISSTAAAARTNYTRIRSTAATKRILDKPLPSITESTIVKQRRNKTNRMYLRRRPLNGTAKARNLFNLTDTSSKSLTTIATRNTTLMSMETTKASRNDAPKTTKPYITETPKPRTHRHKPTKVTDVRNNSLGTVESAIMTISSNNAKRLGRSRQKQATAMRNKKQATFGNSINTRTTNVPLLPIEVYFKKINNV